MRRYRSSSENLGWSQPRYRSEIMASRERLGHLKFMQRAKLREEEKAKQEKAQASGDHWVANRKPGSSCAVIVEGDPKPSIVSGRMSFRSFNPSFEVSPAEAASSQKPVVSSQETSVISSHQQTVTSIQKSAPTSS